MNAGNTYHEIIVDTSVYYWLLKIGRLLRREDNREGSFTDTIIYLKEQIEKGE